MSYNLYVTRKKYWADDADRAPNITQNKFTSFVDKHPDLSIATQDTKNIEAIFRPPSHELDLSIVWSRGNVRADMITVPREVFILLLEMARVFKASVQGEEGEQYTKENMESFPTIVELDRQTADSNRAFAQSVKQERRRRKAWLIVSNSLVILGRLFLVLFLIATGFGIIWLPFLFVSWYRKSRKNQKNQLYPVIKK